MASVMRRWLSRFADHGRVVARGGEGGLGAVTWEVIAGARQGARKRPAGGSGGRGGDVIVEASASLDSLSLRQMHVVAGKGENGGVRFRKGGRGDDKVVLVPCGTTVRVLRGESARTHDLVHEGSRAVVARGGAGGMGNGDEHRRTKRMQRPGDAFGHIAGKPGQSSEVTLEVRTIADVGLVGKPNAGKSSLLRALSAAEPEVADYPFTTLRPHVGVCDFNRRDADGAVVDCDRIRVADVPGLIEGAADGKGLGLAFMRHLARTRALVFVLDASDSPCDDLATLASEIAAYPHALPRCALVFANKLDKLDNDDDGAPHPRPSSLDVLEALRDAVRDLEDSSVRFLDVLGGSALTGRHIPELAVRLRRLVRGDVDRGPRLP